MTIAVDLGRKATKNKQTITTFKFYNITSQMNTFYLWLSLYYTNALVTFFFHKNAVKMYLSYDVASRSEITPCNKIDKPLVVYRFTGNVMTSITTLRT